MPLSDDRGRITQYMFMFTDVSRRVTASHELAASEARFRSALAAMSEGFVLHDPNGAVVQCNEAALRILGITREQLFSRRIGDPAWHLVREDGRAVQGSEWPVAVTLRTGEPQRGCVLGLVR